MIHTHPHSISHHFRRRPGHGFTLIELSVVLVIIGLIVGGVLVGRDLIETAKARALLAQMEKYKTAVNAFRIKYGSLPGDMSPEKACGGACTGGDPADTGFGFAIRAGDTGHGDENSLISKCDDTSWQGRLGCENILFWRDLSEAQMIDGSFITATDIPLVNIPIATASSTLPLYLPLAKGTVAGGHVVAFGYGMPGSPDGPSLTWKNYFIVIGITSIGVGGAVVKKNVVSPAMAYAIDNKFDDGKPHTGAIVSYSVLPNGPSFFNLSGGSPNCTWWTPYGPGEYNPNFFNYLLTPDVRDQPVCSMATPF